MSKRVRAIFRVEADWLDIENDSGRKLLHESLHQVPRLSGRIGRTRTATAIIVDQLLATDLSRTATNTPQHTGSAYLSCIVLHILIYTLRTLIERNGVQFSLDYFEKIERGQVG